MCRSGNLFTFIESWWWQPYGAPWRAEYVSCEGVKKRYEMMATNACEMWKKLLLYMAVIDKMLIINKAFTGWFWRGAESSTDITCQNQIQQSFLKAQVSCHGPLMTNTEYFPFHPNPTVCRLGRVTQTVGSEGYLESEKAREGGERERERSASVTWVWLSSELWILWQRTVLSPAGTQCSALLLNWSRQTRLLGFITIGSSDECAYVWMFSFAVQQCNAGLFKWHSWKRLKMLDSTMAHARY